MAKSVPLTVRLPEDLHAALLERASYDARSLNGEIIFLLREALFPIADADAFQHTRHAVSRMPRYTISRPTVQRRPSK